MLTMFLCAAIVIAKPDPAGDTFVAVLQRNFAAWDKDHNGLLMPAEIDAALADPKLAGADAAAIATIKCVTRDDRFRIRRIDVATVKDDIRLAQPENRGEVMDEDWFSPDWQKAFKETLKRAEVVQAIPLSKSPDLSAMRTGEYGSRVFPAVLAGLVLQRPEAAQKLVTGSAEQTWKIAAPLWSLQLGTITAAQAESCTMGASGWARAVEYGIDQLNRERFPQAAFSARPTNFSERFDNVGGYVRLMSGKGMISTFHRKPSGERSRNGWGYQLVGSPGGLSSGTCQNLAPALAKKKLAVAITDGMTIVPAGANRQPRFDPLPPGIEAFSCFTIVSVDTQQRTITLWSPAVDSFTPRGAASMQAGYPIANGQWTMPLDEFSQVFAGYMVENDVTLTMTGQSRGKK